MPFIYILTNIKEPAIQVFIKKKKQTITNVYSIKKLASTKNAILTVNNNQVNIIKFIIQHIKSLLNKQTIYF